MCSAFGGLSTIFAPGYNLVYRCHRLVFLLVLNSFENCARLPPKSLQNRCCLVHCRSDSTARCPTCTVLGCCVAVKWLLVGRSRGKYGGYRHHCLPCWRRHRYPHPHFPHFYFIFIFINPYRLAYSPHLYPIILISFPYSYHRHPHPQLPIHLYPHRNPFLNFLFIFILTFIPIFVPQPSLISCSPLSLNVIFIPIFILTILTFVPHLQPYCHLHPHLIIFIPIFIPIFILILFIFLFFLLLLLQPLPYPHLHAHLNRHSISIPILANITQPFPYKNYLSWNTLLKNTHNENSQPTFPCSCNKALFLGMDETFTSADKLSQCLATTLPGIPPSFFCESSNSCKKFEWACSSVHSICWYSSPLLTIEHRAWTASAATVRKMSPGLRQRDGGSNERDNAFPRRLNAFRHWTLVDLRSSLEYRLSENSFSSRGNSAAVVSLYNTSSRASWTYSMASFSRSPGPVGCCSKASPR